MSGSYSHCYEDGECFARKGGYCSILNKPDPYTDCSFKKRKRNYTKGKYYPDDPYYISETMKNSWKED